MEPAYGVGAVAGRAPRPRAASYRKNHPQWVLLLLTASVAFAAGMQLADLGTTMLGLQHGLVEENPLMAVALGSFGPLATVAAKLGVSVVLIVNCRRLPLRLSLPLAWAVAAIGTVTVWSNLIQLLHH